MSIDEAAVAKIARLARIRVSDDEKTHFAKEISNILQWIEQLQEVNTENVPLMTSVADMQMRWRADKVTDGNCRDDVLANAPKQEYSCFVVPKVVE